MNEETEKQTKILEEILKWIKFSGTKDVKEVLLNNLTDDTKILIYHYSDGMNAIPFLKDLLGIKGNNVIPKLWDKWKNVGIMEKINVKRGERGRKIFNLEDFGILIPEVKLEETPKEGIQKLSEQEKSSDEKEKSNEEAESYEDEVKEVSEDGQEV